MRLRPTLPFYVCMAAILTQPCIYSFFLTTSKDMTARLYSLDPIPMPQTGRGRYRPKVLTGHRDAVLAAYWSEDETEIYTVGRDGSCFTWREKQDDADDSEEEEVDAMDQDVLPAVASTSAAIPAHATRRWGLAARNYFKKVSTSVVCSAFHPSTSLLVIGFSTGVFGLYTLPDVDSLHTLSVSSDKITSVCTSSDGAWLAFGCATLGQLLVWEWASESYILKQQGHFLDMNTLCHSPDGQIIVTGGDDGKIKLWNVASGFCIATLSEHSAPVTAVEFAKRGKVLFTASMDGTVRVWDLVRYRNFRTLTSPRPVQFGCLAVEGSGEIVCAGSGSGGDTFDIYMWSVQSGKLLDVLSGHEGPVSSLAFSPTGNGMMASTSWDKTVKLWECFKGKSPVESLEVNADALAVAYRFDGAEICVSTLDGRLAFFDPRQGARQTGVLECRRDISPGQKAGDRFGPRANAGGSYFSTLAYSADGTCILAGGNSNWVCLYNVAEKVLLKRWALSHDASLDGTQERLDTRRMTEDGRHIDLIDDIEDEQDLTAQERADRTLPGGKRLDPTQRSTRAISRCKSLQFSPSGNSWAAASTEGLLIFSLEARNAAGMGGGADAFDPMDLDMDLTPENVRAAMVDHQSVSAMVGALRLGDQALLAEVYEHVKPQDIHLVVLQLPLVHLASVLRLVVRRMTPASIRQAANKAGTKADSKSTSTTMSTGGSPHIEFHLLWLASILGVHGPYLRRMAGTGSFAPALRQAAAALQEISANINRVAEDNLHLMLYLWGAIGGPTGYASSQAEITAE